MSEPTEEGGCGCIIMSAWLIGGGICAAVGFPAIIALLVFATVVGGICGVLNLMNMNSGE